MKSLLMFALSLILSGISNADTKTDPRNKELLQLMNERKILADEYYSSLEKKSGFFGNKTKNDLKDSHEKLVEIVKVDNKIMDALNRSLNYKDYEKLNLSYDATSSEQRIRNLSTLNDTLNKQLLRSLEETKKYRSKVKRNHLYIAGMITILLIAGWIFIRDKFYR